MTNKQQRKAAARLEIARRMGAVGPRAAAAPPAAALTPVKRKKAADSFALPAEDDPEEGGPAEKADDRHPKRARGQVNYAEEEGVGPSSTEQQIEDDGESRSFWERWDEQLLRAWLVEFAIPLSGFESRDDLLNTLIIGREDLAQPKGGVELVELQKCWSRVTNRPVAAAPGVYSPPTAHTVAAPSAAPPAHTMAPDKGPVAPVYSSASAPAPAPSAEFIAMEEALRASQAETRSVQKEMRAKLGSLADRHHSCKVCGTATPPGVNTNHAWNCSVCTLRGDLQLDSPENRMLVALRSPGSGSSNSSSSTPAGQSDTAARTPALQGRERVFAEAMVDYPSIAAYKLEPVQVYGNDVMVESAFAEGLKAHESTAYKQARLTLKRVIQAGKLINVGYAMPEPITQAATEEGILGSIEFTAAGIVQRGREGPVALMHTPAEFLRVLVCTILPSLIAQTDATMQWLSFARTVSEINARVGWKGASVFIERQLTHCVTRGIPLSVVDTTMLLSVELAHRMPAPPSLGKPQQQQHMQQQQQQQVKGPPAPMVPRCCNNFNAKGCARGAECHFPHICAQCGGPHAIGTPPCTLKPSPSVHLVPKHAAMTRPGFAKRTGGSVESVHTSRTGGSTTN